MTNAGHTRMPDAYIADHLTDWVAELAVYCAQPSISANGGSMAAHTARIVMLLAQDE